MYHARIHHSNIYQIIIHHTNIAFLRRMSLRGPEVVFGLEHAALREEVRASAPVLRHSG